MTEPDLATWIEPGSEHPSAESLRDYALGRLPEDDLIQCAAHLETCSGCRQFVETVPGDALVALVQSAKQGDKATSDSAMPLRLHRGFEIMAEIGWDRRLCDLTGPQARTMVQVAVGSFLKSMQDSAPEVPFR